MRALPYNEGHSFINETLLSHGLLGTGPVQPVLAISVTTLELYRQCRLRCPQFSVQQWVKVLCDLANVGNSLFLFILSCFIHSGRLTIVKNSEKDSRMHSISTFRSVAPLIKPSRSSLAVIQTHGASVTHVRPVNIRCIDYLHPTI